MLKAGRTAAVWYLQSYAIHPVIAILKRAFVANTRFWTCLVETGKLLSGQPLREERTTMSFLANREGQPLFVVQSGIVTWEDPEPPLTYDAY